MTAPKSKKPSKSEPFTGRTLEYFSHLVSVLIEKFGWPGAAFILIFSFIVAYASAEQKREIIDFYVLGKGFGGNIIHVWFGGIILIGIFGFYFMMRHYRVKIEVLEKEVERIGNEKSKLQELISGRKLQHVVKR